MKPLDVLLILVSLLICTSVIEDRRYGPERERQKAIIRFQRDQLEVVEKKLLQYKRTVGRYPTTEEGLESVTGLREALMSGEDGEFEPARAFLRQTNDIRTIYGVPYVYENRLGGKGFRASPAREEKKPRTYSREVDDDGQVFVSSLGLRDDVRVRWDWWLDATLVFSAGAIAVLVLGYAVVRNRRKNADRVRGVNSIAFVGVAMLIAIVALASSRIGRKDREVHLENFCARNPEVLAEWCQVMEQFAADGDVDAEWARARVKELRLEFGLPATPASGPSGN